MHFKNSAHLNLLSAPALVFSCAVLVSLFLARYAKERWETLTADKAITVSLKNSMVMDNGNVSLLKQLTQDRDSLNIKYRDLMRDMGGSQDLSGILQMIIAKANAADIKFVKMQPQTEVKSGASTTYPMILEMTASYYSYGRFIAALERQPSMLRVDRIAITAQKNGMLDIRTLITCFIQTKP
jgi:Tfp pilus assembly protein PilO